MVEESRGILPIRVVEKNEKYFGLLTGGEVQKEGVWLD